MTIDEIRQRYPLPPGWGWGLLGLADDARAVAEHAWRREPAYAALVIATGMAHLFRYYLAGTCGRCMWATPWGPSTRRCSYLGNALPTGDALVSFDDWCPAFCPAPETPCD